MSKKIPFLEMFSALRRWTELSNAAEGWLIVSAAIDKASRSARITAQKNGVTVISLSDFAVSPLTKNSDINLFTTPRNASLFQGMDRSWRILQC